MIAAGAGLRGRERDGQRESAPVVIRQAFGVATFIQYARDMPNGSSS